MIPLPTGRACLKCLGVCSAFSGNLLIAFASSIPCRPCPDEWGFLYWCASPIKGTFVGGLDLPLWQAIVDAPYNKKGKGFPLGEAVICKVTDERRPLPQLLIHGQTTAALPSSISTSPRCSGINHLPTGRRFYLLILSISRQLSCR